MSAPPVPAIRPCDILQKPAAAVEVDPLKEEFRHPPFLIAVDPCSAPPMTAGQASPQEPLIRYKPPPPRHLP